MGHMISISSDLVAVETSIAPMTILRCFDKKIK